MGGHIIYPYTCHDGAPIARACLLQPNFQRERYFKFHTASYDLGKCDRHLPLPFDLHNTFLVHSQRYSTRDPSASLTARLARAYFGQHTLNVAFSE